ncbi:MAG: helix-turn-helix domain-containing protein [Anaerolineae bacterium]
MDTYMSTQEVADRLGVSVFTIRRYIRSGKLRAVRLEGGYRVSRDDIAEFLKAREIGHQPGQAGASDPSPRGRSGGETPPQMSSAVNPTR